MKMLTRYSVNSLAILLITVLLTGCSGTGNNLTTPASADRLINETIIGPDGGSIDHSWLALEFPTGALVSDVRVGLYETDFTKPRKGTLTGGFPVHIYIDAVDGSASSLFAPGTGYKCIFHLDLLPEGSGDFTTANENIDIYGEWVNPDGTFGRGAAWAKRVGDDIYRVMSREDVTVGVVDFTNIPELTAEAVITDDPRTLAEPYTRFADIDFNENNLGYIGERIPVILIHGLQLDNMEDEPFDFSYMSAEYGEDGWIPFIDALNSNDDLFDDFKFFWFCYPSGTTIFGVNGIAATLRSKIAGWAWEHPECAATFRPMIIVCHSMGGLVAREFTAHYAQGIATPRVIAVATPHYGSPIVNVGADIVDIPGFGWLDTFLTDGVKDLACDETIKYDFMWITWTADIDENLNLRRLNLDFPEGDSRLIEFGSTTTSKHNPSFGSTHYLALTVMDMVSSPSWLEEEYKGYHSDTVVNWTSQYYTKYGDPDLTRNSDRMHMGIMADPAMHGKLITELYNVKDEWD